jgi:hypothetical protein
MATIRKILRLILMLAAIAFVEFVVWRVHRAYQVRDTVVSASNPRELDGAIAR